MFLNGAALGRGNSAMEQAKRSADHSLVSHPPFQNEIFKNELPLLPHRSRRDQITEQDDQFDFSSINGIMDSDIEPEMSPGGPSGKIGG